LAQATLKWFDQIPWFHQLPIQKSNDLGPVRSLKFTQLDVIFFLICLCIYLYSQITFEQRKTLYILVLCNFNHIYIYQQWDIIYFKQESVKSTITWGYNKFISPIRTWGVTVIHQQVEIRTKHWTVQKPGPFGPECW
jgi:hypothetical protein